MTADYENIKVYDLIATLEAMEVFTEILNYYMDQAEMTGKELAMDIKISESIVSYWRNRKSLPSPENLFLIAKALILNREERYNLFVAYQSQKMIDDLASYLQEAERHQVGIHEIPVVEDTLKIWRDSDQNEF